MKMARAFVGHKQAVQTQIRLHRSWRMIRVSTVCLQNASIGENQSCEAKG